MPAASERRAWALLTKARNGTVSILRDLTLAECRQSYQRLNPNYGQTRLTYEGDECYISHYNSIGGAEIELREAFGPEDWDRAEVATWDAPWPKWELIKLSDPRHPHFKGQ